MYVCAWTTFPNQPVGLLLLVDSCLPNQPAGLLLLVGSWSAVTGCCYCCFQPFMKASYLRICLATQQILRQQSASTSDDAAKLLLL